MCCHLYWLLAAGLVLLPLRAGAQGVAGSFEQLQVLVKTGDTVTVRETSGQETTGRIASLSASALTLVSSDTGRELKLSEADVSIIRERRQDSLGNGALIGLGIGAVSCAIAMAIICSNEDCEGEAPEFVAVYAGLGTAVGVGVDALIVTRHVIYEKRAGAVTLGVMPLLGPTRTGIAASMKF